MTRHEFVVLTKAKPGREADLRRWYDEHHLGDILSVPGIVSARCCDVELIRSDGAAMPEWSLMVLYQIEAEDFRPVLEEISRRRIAGELAWTDAIDGEGTLQIIALPPRG
jgi:hypothetical protein